MKSILLFLILMVSLNVKAQTFKSERFTAEMALNVSLYHSLSISIEKEFTYGKFKFGPRAELVNLFTAKDYKFKDSTLQMSSQFRLRLVQVEYQVNPILRVGISPVWMLGPLPPKGYYKTPTTFYTHIQIKEGLSLETSITTSKDELFQLSFRKVI